MMRSVKFLLVTLTPVVVQGFRQLSSSRQTRLTSLLNANSVGFIGLGLMGDGMARRLLANDIPLKVWNRSKEKCDALQADYKELVGVENNPADVIRSCDIIFTMLSTPEVNRNVYNGPGGILSAVTAGKKIVDCATLAPLDMIWASNEVKKRGGLFVEGPVSGSKVPAEKGQLIFMLAGDESLAIEAQPYLAFMGKSNYYLGEIGSATKMKLIVNAMLSNFLASLSEGISMTKDCSLSTDILIEVLSQGAMASPLISLKGPKIAAGDHAPNFPLKHAYKDLLFAVDLASELKSKVCF
jgi:3-hydroxyisobutyrate dehydrogenase-like beta-hydroxyacid dehydrogenase